MSITSIIAKDRGGDFVNKNLCYLGTSVTSFVITMPVAEIPNKDSRNGIRAETGPDGVLCTLSKIISCPSSTIISSDCNIAMYDAVGDAETDQAGNSVTIWKVWVKGIHGNKVAKQIEQSIRNITPEKFPGYTFNTVTVEVGEHYYTS